MTWHWPAYPNQFGPYWPNPDELPGQPSYSGLFPLPQINVKAMQADPNLSQCYHPVMVVAAVMSAVIGTYGVRARRRTSDFLVASRTVHPAASRSSAAGWRTWNANPGPTHPNVSSVRRPPPSRHGPANRRKSHKRPPALPLAAGPNYTWARWWSTANRVAALRDLTPSLA